MTTGSLDEFGEFCSELTLDSGNRMHLEGFERELLADFFAGVRETLVLLPKKNGKTTLLAALGLYHLLTEFEAACYVAAASREQASLIYGAAIGFIHRGPEALRDQVVVRQGYREIWQPDDLGRMRVLASDVDTADGVLGTLILVDELHRHKSAALLGVLLDGLGPRQGQAVTISTAGDDEDSPLGKLRKKAYALPGMRREGAHRYVSAPDFAMHEWALDPDDDRDDLDLVKTANPASWQTVDELRRRKESPSMTPWRWARFACGVWVHGEEAAISDREWAACADPDAAIPAGVHEVFVGLDLAWRYDTTAAVPICKDGEGVVIGKPAIITPPGDGTSIDADEIWQVIEQMAARWPQMTIVADPNAGAPELLQKIERQLPHVTLSEFPQSPFPMSVAAGRLQEAIAAGKIRHPDDPGLTAHVLAAVPVSVGENFRFKKSKRNGPSIDALIALAMAFSAMVGEGEQEEFRRAAFDGAGRPSAKAMRVEKIECRGGCGRLIHPEAAYGVGLCVKCTKTGAAV